MRPRPTFAMTVLAALLLAACSSAGGSVRAANSGPAGRVPAGGTTSTAGGAPPAATATSTSPTGGAATGTTSTAGSGSAVAGTGTAGPGRITSTGPTTTGVPGSSTTSMTTPPTTTTTAPPAPPSGTGAYGYVTAGPTCPVERPDQPCPPKPVSDEVDARNGGGSTVASATSGADGHYALRLAPGRYTLVVVTPSGWPHCPDTPVSVTTGSATRADISCDTGIR